MIRHAVIYTLLVINLVLMIHLSLEHRMYAERARLLSESITIHEEYQDYLLRYTGTQEHLVSAYKGVLTQMLRDLGLQKRSSYVSGFTGPVAGGIGPVGGSDE